MLAGENVVLRAPTDGDLPVLVAMRNDLETQMSMMALPRANSTRRVGDWVAKILDDPRSVFFIVAARDTDEPVGYIQLREMDFVNGVGELGICLRREAQGRGYARQALQLLEDYASRVFNLRKIVLRVLTSNARAVALYDALNYSTVGRHERHFYQSGAYHDVTVMEKFLEAAGRA